MTQAFQQQEQMIGEFEVYLATFEKHPGGNPRRKGVARIYPGRIDLEVDKKALGTGSIVEFVRDAFTNKDERLSINLTGLKPFRVPMSRLIALMPPEGGGIQFCTADIRKQKQAMEQFIRAIEQATGQTIEKYNNPKQKLMLYIFAGLTGAALLVAIIVGLVRKLG